MAETLPEMLLHTLEAYPKDDLMLYKKGGGYVSLSTAEFGKRTRLFARGLHKLGVKPADKVVILSENRPLSKKEGYRYTSDRPGCCGREPSGRRPLSSSRGFGARDLGLPPARERVRSR